MKAFFHKSDLDGACSGAIVKFRHPECIMIPIDYDDIPDFSIINPGEQVFMVDFCFANFRDMIRLATITDGNFTWIDHHMTAIDKYVEAGVRIDGVRYVGLAGCELTWKHLFPDKTMPIIVEFLGRYDVWDHSDPRVLPFQYGCRIHDTNPNNQKFWRPMLRGRYIDSRMANIIDSGNNIIEYLKSDARTYCELAAFPVTISNVPYRIIAVNKLSNSQLFEYGIPDLQTYDIMMPFVRLSSGQWKVSMFSVKGKDVNVGEICKQFGGGGHRGAGGFITSTLPF